MYKPLPWLTLILIAIFLTACGGSEAPLPTATSAPTSTPTIAPTIPPTPTPEPTATPTPLPEPTATPTPLPKPTVEADAATPAAAAGMRIDTVDAGFLFTDAAYGYELLLPGEDWIPFIPGQDDLNTVFNAAEEALPNVDVQGIKQSISQAGVEFRIFAFYTGEEARDENFAVNLNVNVVPLDQPYDMGLIVSTNKAQLPQIFPDATIESDSLIANDQGVQIGMITIRNEIALGPDAFPLAQTFIFFQTPENALVTITISLPWDKKELLDPIIEQIINSITLTS